VRRGIFLPPFDDFARPDRLVELALLAERSGWDGIFLWDHLLYSEPVEEILDPYICLAAMAAATTTIQLGPMVTPLIRRRPAVVARQAVTLDLLSNGRLVLGFGIGDDGGKGELSRFGEETDAASRGRSFDEGLNVLTGLLAGEAVFHQGENYRADGVTFRPVAERAGGIPIWLAARWPNRAPIRRAARFQGVVIIQMTEPADVATLRRQLLDAGADLDHFDIVVNAQLGDDPRPWAKAGVSWLLTQFGPYNLDVDEVTAIVSSGPPST
jgi:alkanesulfonate monooxygenase SsuD/methylene tetrahydromethanopterin reductase-like flavin-dependent oxidoreductase (luciferase family)